MKTQREELGTAIAELEEQLRWGEKMIASKNLDQSGSDTHIKAVAG
jgi:hypothetical protein